MRVRTFLLLLGILAPPCSGAELRVVTTTADLASILTAVGGERVAVTSLSKGYQNPHFVDAKPSYVVELRRADLLVAVGLELEVGWLPALLQQCRNPKLLTPAGYLDASTTAKILEKPTQQVTRAEGDVHPFGNPHYWLDPENGRAIARAVAAKLGELDAAGKSTYETNLAAFETRLTAKEQEWRAKMQPYAGTKVVTYHNSWPNFLESFGLVAADYVEPRPGIPPSPSHTLELINRITAEKVRVILVEPYFDTKTPDFIATKTSAKVVMFYPSVGGLPEIKDYFDLFDHDIDLLVAALGGRP